jgi:hypothetical protein
LICQEDRVTEQWKRHKSKKRPCDLKKGMLGRQERPDSLPRPIIARLEYGGKRELSVKTHDARNRLEILLVSDI